MHKVCICIPTFNSSKTIYETIDSILNQTYKNIEILIIDNASTDNTINIVREHFSKDQRIKIYEFKENIGGEGNFTRCIQLAFGDYTAIYHSDDIYEPTIVEKQVAFLETHLEAGAVFTAASLINGEGKFVGSAFIPRYFLCNEGWDRIYDFNTIFRLVLRYTNPFICSSAMVRTSIYQQEIKTWRGELFGTSADLDTWLRILKNHCVGVIPEQLIRYRVSNVQGTFQYNYLRTKRADILRVIDYYLEQNDVKGLASKKDIINYKQLDRIDSLKRASSYIILEQWDEAKKLCNDVISLETLKALFICFRGIKAFLFSLLLWSIVFTKSSRLSKQILQRLLMKV